MYELKFKVGQKIWVKDTFPIEWCRGGYTYIKGIDPTRKNKDIYHITSTIVYDKCGEFAGFKKIWAKEEDLEPNYSDEYETMAVESQENCYY